jgi:hypothetical protein
MKRFFNLTTILMLAMVAASLVASFLSTPVNWLALIWMGIAALWVVIARLHQLTAEDYQKLYNSQSKAVATLKKALTDAIHEKTELEIKYKDLVKEHEQWTQPSTGTPRAVSSKKPAGTKKNKIQDIKDSLAAMRPKQETAESEPAAEQPQKKTRWKKGKYSDLNKPADTE